MSVQVLVYRISNESSEQFVQGRNAVQGALVAAAIPGDAWLSSELTHNEESDYIDIVITYDDSPEPD